MTDGLTLDALERELADGNTSGMQTAVDVTLYMRESKVLLLGQDPKKNKNFTPGIKNYAQVMSYLSKLAKQGQNPFIKLFLIEHEQGMERLDQMLSQMNVQLPEVVFHYYQAIQMFQKISEGLERVGGFCEQNNAERATPIITKLLSESAELKKLLVDAILEKNTAENMAIDLDKPVFDSPSTIRLELSSSYGYRMADMIVKFDKIANTVLALKSYGKIDIDKKGEILDVLNRNFVTLILNPFQKRRKIDEKMTTQDVIKKNENYVEHVNIFGEIPEDVLAGRRVPKYY